MELWIRSQDKEYIAKVDNIRIKHEYEQKKVNDNYGRTCAYINDEYRCSYIYSDSTCLGEYATKERALEVLDEIQSILKPIIKINYEYDDSQPIMNGEWLKSIKEESKIEELSTYVYEMPKE